MSDLELVSLEVELQKSRPLIVIAWYRPPSCPVDLFAKLESVLSFFDNENKEVIILGYTNCDLTENAVLDNNARHMLKIYDHYMVY